MSCPEFGEGQGESLESVAAEQELKWAAAWRAERLEEEEKRLRGGSIFPGSSFPTSYKNTGRIEGGSAYESCSRCDSGFGFSSSFTKGNGAGRWFLADARNSGRPERALLGSVRI